ncbi:DUF1510 family protein [Pseudalkalibacillus hwajinpoensis]|uniref:YrrS family protein n=1 Tax=Guptibacillus hwajinpoensis TaxID=208199 RepID=UPI00325AF286
MRSRYGARHSKRRQNIILNSLIGIVIAVILVLVANIVFTGNGQQTAGEEEGTQSESSTNSGDSNSEDAVTSDEADSEASDESAANSENAGEDSANEDSKDEDKDQEKAKEKEEKKENEEKEKEQEKEKEKEESEQASPGEPNLEGPWQPVGTSQSGPHASDYTQGSVDWNEKLKAVESVVGFPPQEMVVHWLGGNGGPQKSKATVSQKGANDTKYLVELEWVDGKGWKAVSATEQ